jgi:hypothetical protein
MSNFDEHHLLAALIYARFNFNADEAIAAWKRMLQNDGWDDGQGRREWLDMASRGLKDLRSIGFRY